MWVGGTRAESRENGAVEEAGIAPPVGVGRCAAELFAVVGRRRGRGRQGELPRGGAKAHGGPGGVEGGPHDPHLAGAPREHYAPLRGLVVVGERHWSAAT